MVSDLGCFL